MSSTYAPFASPVLAMPAAAVPHEDVVLESGTDATAREAVALCLRLVPGWADLRPEEVAVSVISGGITNSLLKVWHASRVGRLRVCCAHNSARCALSHQLVPSDGRDPVVLRIFGLNTEFIIDRDRELPARGQAPTCWPFL